MTHEESIEVEVKMTARWAAVACSVLALSAAVALTSGVGSSRATPASAGKRARARRVRLESVEDSIAKYLAGLAKDKAKNFIIEQLGLKPPSELDRVLSEIKALSAQLRATEVRLTAQIAELQFEHRIDDLTDLTTDVDHMYRDYFLPLVTAGTQLKTEQEKQPRDQAAIAAAMALYHERKERLKNFADSVKVTTITDKIHNRLQPSTGKGVLREYGKVILTTHRIVNSSDSEKVALLYTFLEEHQALATWMSVETAIAVAGGYEHAKTEVTDYLDDFLREQTQQRSPTTANGLLPAIPAGVVIDTRPDASEPNYSTQDKPMFTYVGGTYAYAPWAEQAWKAPVPPTVQVAVARVNGSRLRGFTGWGVPSGAQLDGMFSGLPAHKTATSIADYIYDVFGHPNTPVPRPWIWISNTSAQRYCYETSTHKVRCRDVDAHAGKSTDDFMSNVHPRFNGYVDLDRLYREAQGGLFLVRKTDQDYL